MPTGIIWLFTFGLLGIGQLIDLVLIPGMITNADLRLAAVSRKETKHLRAFRDSKLKPGEQVVGFLEGRIGEMMGTGDKTQHNGQFVVTNIRACFYCKGLFGEVFETIPLSKITSVETLSQMGYRVLRLHTSDDELAFKTFESKEHFDEVYDQLEAARDANP